MTTNANAGQPFMSARITGYAYETVANKAIKTGTAAIAATATENPADEAQASKRIQDKSGPSLGMLAAGADAVPMWRREEKLGSK